MKRNIVILIIIALAPIAFIVFRSSKLEVPVVDVSEDNTPGGVFSSSTPIVPTQKPVDLSVKDKAWKVLTEYLAYAKDQNVEGIKSLSYQISPECETDPKGKACIDKISTVYFFGQDLKKADFKYTWSDSKQIILTTDFKFEENDQMISKTRGMIYFVIQNDKIKLLKFNPAKGAVVAKGEASKQEIDERLTRYSEDKDEDGMEDYLEECLSISQDKGCVKTDPKIRDTNRNGFWDGIEALFY